MFYVFYLVCVAEIFCFRFLLLKFCLGVYVNLVLLKVFSRFFLVV